ncbi:hypothetical protein ACHAAC_07815 [Aeromicrobium sp. CF4.19]|uniref:hypothetical protein n=1 Tax=Aeromicrobium sp. CF4.19 TaxID=3373082 RepID=UPI003EE639F1
MGQPTAEGRFSRLPEPIRLEDTIAELDVRAVPDPESGRDTERDFLLRHALP